MIFRVVKWPNLYNSFQYYFDKHISQFEVSYSMWLELTHKYQGRQNVFNLSQEFSYAKLEF